MKKILLVLVCALLPGSALIGCGDTKPKPEGTQQQQSGTEPECGNGQKETGETCDDGNKSAGDGCSATCTVEEGYECKTAGSACTKKEQPPVEVECHANLKVDKEKGELCDMAIPKGQEGYCPRTPADCRELSTNLCQKVSLEGSECTSKCVLGTLETKPTSGDGCCPEGANPSVDTDCFFGAACTENADCGTSGKLICTNHQMGATGYCTVKTCTTDADCQHNGICIVNGGYCAMGCKKDTDCTVKGDSVTKRVCGQVQYQVGPRAVVAAVCRVVAETPTENYGKACTKDEECGGLDSKCFAPQLGGYCLGMFVPSNTGGALCNGDETQVRSMPFMGPILACVKACSVKNGKADCGNRDNVTCVALRQGSDEGGCRWNNDGPNPTGGPCKLNSDCKGDFSVCYKVEEGNDALGFCRPGCSVDTDCGTGELCKGVGLFNQYKGLTDIEDLLKKTGICVKACTDDAACKIDGMVDRPTPTTKTNALKCVDWKDGSSKNGCYLEFNGTKKIGESCTKETDCAKGGPAQTQCILVNKLGDKICTVSGCKNDAECASLTAETGSVCQPLREGGENTCLKECTDDSECGKGTQCRALGGDSAHKSQNYCLPEIKATGSKCTTNDDCGEGRVCINGGKYEGGYCSSLCETKDTCGSGEECVQVGKLSPTDSSYEKKGFCAKPCDTKKADTCETWNGNSHLKCGKDGDEELCLPAAKGSGKVGDPCTSLTDCSEGFCLNDTSRDSKGAFCTKGCKQDTECGGGTDVVCNKTAELCQKKCTQDSDCSEGQACVDQGGVKGCLQKFAIEGYTNSSCNDDSGCQEGYRCTVINNGPNRCLKGCEGLLKGTCRFNEECKAVGKGAALCMSLCADDNSCSLQGFAAGMKCNKSGGGKTGLCL